MSQNVQLSDLSITELKTGFLAQSSTDLYDEQDINEIQSKDAILLRYLEYRKGVVDEALKSLINPMKWRKTYGVNRLGESSFPIEFYKSGTLFTYGQDLNGAQLIVFRVMTYIKMNDWTELLKRFIVFLIEKENRRLEENRNTGVCIVLDCRGAGITNVNLDLLSFIVQTLRDYYPMVLQSVVICDIPSILHYLFKLMQSWLKKEEHLILHFVTRDDIKQYISEEELPDFMNGTNQLSYRCCPKNAPTIHQIANRLDIKQKGVDKLLEYLEPYLK